MSQRIPPDIHKLLHEKPTKITYKAKPVREVLNNIWLQSDIALDLAFYSYFSRDQDTAKLVLEINRSIDELLAQFILHTSLAYGRSREGSFAVLLAYYYASSMDTIVDSVKDIVYMLLTGYNTLVSYENILYYTDGEVIAPYTLTEDVKVVDITDKYPLDVILVAKDGKWRIAPGLSEKISKGSRIYLRGFKENVYRFLRDKGLETVEKPLEHKEAEQLVKGIIELKDFTRLMVDLAHYSLMEANPGVIQEVEDLEVYVDWKHLQVLNTLRECFGRIDSSTHVGLTTMLKELEDIADASNTISHITMMIGETPGEYYDVFKKVFETIGETLRTITVEKEVELDKLTLWLRKYGGSVLAVKSGSEWIAHPLAKNIVLKPGDKILLAHQAEFTDEVNTILSKISQSH
uniref:Potassium transporter TrkA n=1 Tax=Thermosphaera aggregans TaxID=54254 RepID=A0A7C2BLB3_9CREN